MKEKQKIVLSSFVKGLKKSEIVKQTGLNWRTVDKYIRDYSNERQKLVTTKDDFELPEIIDEIVKAPKYKSSNRKKKKVTDELIKEVRNCLDKNESHWESGRKKQCMKKIDIFEYLKDEKGFDVGYTTVCNVVNEELKKKREAFIKQQYLPGKSCEFDWGEVKLVIEGQKRKFHMAVFTASYSNYRYAVLFERENMQAFLSSHAKFFSDIGGSYKEMVYDNMRVAVKKFVGRHEKEATDGLLKLSLYYLFDFRFCNIARGNEKGHVERSVEYIRRKSFSRKFEFSSIEEANKHLKLSVSNLNSKKLSQEENKTAEDLFIEEIPFLSEELPLFECSETTSCRVDKYSTISISQNRYSVPDDSVGKVVDVKIYSDKIVVYVENKKLCEHVRTYGNHEWVLDLDHYLSTLLKKPGALTGSVAFNNSKKEVRELYDSYFTDNRRDFINLLVYIKDKNLSIQTVNQTIEKIIKSGCKTISTDTIKFLVEQKGSTYDKTISFGKIEVVSEKQLSEYNTLYGKALLSSSEAKS